MASNSDKEKQQVIDTLLRWRKDPAAFVREALGVEPEKNQIAVLDAIPKNKFIAVKSGHGVGKTALESWVILWFLTCYPSAKIPITAPTEDQLTKILWPEIAKWLQKSDLRHHITWTKSKVFINGEEQTTFAVYRTASKPEALQGFHDDNILFILEEASGIEDEIWDPVEGALTSGNARAIALGNPTRPEGNFYRAFTDQAEFWTGFTINGEESERVSRTYIDRMAKKYGKESDVYKVRVLGQFPSQVSDAFIPLYLCEQSLKYMVEHEPRLRMGVDVARFGDDYSVWVIRGGGKIVHAVRKQTLDTMQIVGETIALAKEYNISPTDIAIDVIGVGGGVVDRLNELGWAVGAVNNGMKPTDEEMYFNMRAELWGMVRRELLDEKLCLKIEEDREMTNDLCGELASPKYQYTSKGQYQLESKEEMKRRGVGSPDIADALTLTYYISDYTMGNTRSGRGLAYPSNY